MDELQNIQSKIYVIRGQRVMLDRDLASMYGVITLCFGAKFQSPLRPYMGFTISTLRPNEVIISQNLATLGMMSPFSTREMYDLVELMRLASSAWVTFASLRASCNNWPV